MMLLASVSPVISYDEAIRKAFFAKVGAANTLRVNDDRFTAFYITNIIGVQKNHTLREEASGIECIFSGDYLRQLASELDAFNWIVSSNIVAADDVFSPSILNNFPVSKTWFAWSRFLSLCYRVINGEVIEVPVDGSHTDIRAEILRRGFHLMLTVLDRAEILSSINRNIKLDIIEQFENLELLTNNVFIMIFKAMVGRSKVSLAMANDIFPNPANNTTMSTHLPFIVNHLLQCIRGLNSPSTALAKIMRDLQSSSRELINQIMDLDFILTCGTDIIRHVASIVHMVKAADEGNSLSCRKIINCAFQLAENATSADDTANAEALITFTIDMGAAQIVATDDGLVDKMLSSGEQGFRFLQVCADKLASAAVACPTDAVNNVSELIKRMELSFDTDNESKWTFFTIKVFEKLRASLNQWPAQDLIDCTGILVNKMGIFAKSVAVLQILCDIDVLVRSFVFEALDIISQVSALSIMFRKRLVDILVPILSNSSSVGSDKILSYLGICQNALMGTSRSCPRKMVELAGTDVETKRLIESFEELVANKFPIDTVALDQSSPGGIEFIALLSGYLSILVSTGSVDLLGPLLPSLRAGSKHRFYRWIVKSFSKLISGMDMCLDNVLAMFNFCYRILTDKDEDVKVKHTVKNYIWVPLLARAPMDIMVTLASLSLISDGSVTKLKALSESSSVLFVFVSLIQKATPSSSEDSESFYVTLQCAYILLEALYDRCAISIIKSDIAQAYAGPAATGKELTTALCRAAHKQVRITITSKTLEQQGASSAAFNCLLTVVAKTQSEEKHYDNFIFTEKSTEPYWKHIIECQTSYVFQAECSLFSTRMLGPSVDANDNIPPNSFGAANGSSKFGLNSFSKDYFGSSLHTLSSQMAESLSNDAVATNGNANHQAKGFGVSSVVDDDIFFATQSADGGDLALKSSRHNNYDNTVSMIRTDILNDAVAGFDDYSVSLELNDINTQSCMGPLIRVILRMAFLFNERWQLTPAITPKWLREILTRIEDVALDRNIRLFFLRLLFNQPITSIVSTWTSEIIPVVIEASISLTCNSNCGMVQEYNYFLRDIVFTLVDTWASADVIVDAIPNCSQFICSIIGLCYNSKTPLLNENVSSITSLISLWAGKGQISLDSIGPILQPALSPLFSSAIQPTGGAHAAASSRGSEAVKQRLTGLKLIRCFLDNGLDLLKSEVFNSAGSYVLSYVTEAIKYPRKEVLQLASAVVGRLLVIIKTAKYRVIGECDGFELLVERTIASKLAQKGGLDDVATMIFAISEKYTQFGNRELILRLLSMFSQLSSRSKSYMLWFLVRSTRVYDPPLEVVDYLSPYWGPLLSDLFTVTEGRGSRMKHIRVIRLYTIRLIYRHVPGIKLAWFSSIIGKSAVEGLSLVTTVDSNNEGNLLVRKEAFALLIKLYDYFNTKLEQPYAHSVIDPTVLDTKQMITELRQRILIMLMKGLTDIDDTGMNQSNPCNNSVVDSLRSNMEGNSNIITSVDIGIRRMVYDFLKEQVSIMGPDVESAPTGVSKKRRRTDELSMHRRCCALMTQYYDPQCSELWLNYAGYLLLDVCVSDNNGYSSTKHIFDRGLANDTQFSKMEVYLYVMQTFVFANYVLNFLK